MILENPALMTLDERLQAIAALLTLGLERYTQNGGFVPPTKETQPATRKEADDDLRIERRVGASLRQNRHSLSDAESNILKASWNSPLANMRIPFCQSPGRESQRLHHGVHFTRCQRPPVELQKERANGKTDPRFSIHRRVVFHQANRISENACVLVHFDRSRRFLLNSRKTWNQR